LIEPQVFIAFVTLCMYVPYFKYSLTFFVSRKKRRGTWKTWLWCL